MTDALTGIRTSFIGRAMEDSYRKCNLEGGKQRIAPRCCPLVVLAHVHLPVHAFTDRRLYSGRGSDTRRKDIIRRRLAQDRLFTDLMSKWRQGFREIADQMQENIRAIIVSNLTQIRETLDIVRRENAANEGEMDAAFRNRVNEALMRAQAAHQGTLEGL